MANTKVRKAVIAAAGFGTRFLPQTKAMPKEMLPILDKPVIQYIVEELVNAGIEDIIIITGYHKRSIEDHFDEISGDLKANLQASGKEEILKQTEHISNLANFAYVRQKGPYGNATPIMNARHLIGDEPFIFTYADDLIIAEPNHFKQLIKIYQETNGCVLPCLEIHTEEEFKRYGVIEGTEARQGLVKMESIVEKPGKNNTTSNLASVGGYLLTSGIFPYLEKLLSTHDPAKGEFQVQPAMRQMIDDGIDMHAMKIENARYYDTGNKLEYLKTVADFAINDPEMGKAFKAHLRARLDEDI